MRQTDRGRPSVDSTRVRLLLTVDHPAQQLVPGFRAMIAQPLLSSQVLYWTTDASRLDPGFNRVVQWDVDLINGYSLACPPTRLPTYRRLMWCWRRLRRLAPDAIIAFGWASPVSRLAIVYALVARIPLLFYGDSSMRESWKVPDNWLRALALRVLFRLAAGAVSTGTSNTDYYRHYGMPIGRIRPGVLPIDVDPFLAARHRRPGPRRQYEQVPDSMHIVYAGKMTEGKAPNDLVRALSVLAGDPSWSATFVGDGPVLEQVRSHSSDLGLSERIKFVGFANTSAMPDLLATADVFVLPSLQDARGLVAVEAAAAGAAVIVSDATGVWGGQDELVEHNVSGLVYPAGRPAELAGQLRRLLDDRALLETIRTEGTRRSEWFGPFQFAQATAAAVRRAVEPRRKPHRLK